MELPNCLDCKYAEQGFPCHKADGSYDFAKVGRAVVLHGRTFSPDGENLDDAVRNLHAWASDCAFEVEQDYPHLLLPLIVAAMDASETPQDAAYVAAGLLENAVVKHGPLLIGKIEQLAARSPKFRYFLSAIWGESRTDPAVWQRVCTAVGARGRMDADGRTPSDGVEVSVLSEAEAIALMNERVAASAAALKL